MFRSRNTATKVAATAVVVGLIGAVAGVGTWSAFSATTSNNGNTFSAGSVSLTDNDSGSAMLSLTAAKPGDTDTSCIDVTFTGSIASTVRLYGATTGTGLDPYLDLTVTRGTMAAGSSFDSCTGFTPDGTSYGNGANGVVYSGTLQGYPDDYATGIVDPFATSPRTWLTGEKHAYKFVVTVQNNDAAQGKNATQQFTWEARS